MSKIKGRFEVNSSNSRLQITDSFKRPGTTASKLKAITATAPTHIIKTLMNQK
jgi:hypothetical protein